MKPSRRQRPASGIARPSSQSTPAGRPSRAQQLEHAGRLDEALAAHLEAVEAHPDDPTLLLPLGNLLARLGRWDDARRCYEPFCRAQPDHAVAHHNLGVALSELGRTRDALAAFETAIRLKPDYAAAFYSLALCYRALGAPDAALLSLQCAAQVDPRDVRYPIERARVHIAGRHFAIALAELERAEAMHPTQPELLNLRGIALKHLRRAPDAIAAYDAALRLKPNLVEALNNRGNLLQASRKFSAAVADFDEALRLAPDLDWVPGSRLYAALHLFDWSDFGPRLQRLLTGVAQGRRCVQPLALQSLVDDPAAHRRAAAVWMESLGVAAAGTPSVAPRAATATRIKLAYVSRDFRSHPVSFLFAEVIELHDRSRFEVIGIHYGTASQDAMQARLRAAFDTFLDFEDQSDAQIAALCRRLEIDVAVDLTGLTDGARSGIFLHRAAPIQASYLGYLGSFASPAYDYLIADPVLIPAEERAHYAERVIYLPSYQANDRHRPRPAPVASSAAHGVPDAGFVYCCFNNPCKISPASFDVWARVLTQVPGSVLWVLEEDEHAADHLRAHAQRLGLCPTRIVFAARASREQYLANLASADLFLDTWPYNAGTTASDALWMGLPVVTLMGRSFPSRMAASVLHAAGLPELVTTTEDDFVRTAVQLALDRARYAALKSKLEAQRRHCALFDTPTFTRHLEVALGTCVRRAALGLEREDVVITPAGPTLGRG